MSGELKRGSTAATESKSLPVIEIRNNGPESRKLLQVSGASTHRSVYLPMVRGIIHDVLQVFDFAEQGMVTGKRSNTTVPPQALFLLNDPLVRKSALVKSKRIASKSSEDLSASITTIYRESFQRNPSELELATAIAFIQDYELEFGKLLEERNGAPSSAALVADSPEVKLISTEASISQNVAAPEDSRGEEAQSTASALELEPGSSREAALAAFVQSLYASAEFRFVR